MTITINAPIDYATRVVRDSVYGSTKYHLGIDRMTAVCGATASTPFGWPLSGERDEFERVCPELICKRCVKRALAH